MWGISPPDLNLPTKSHYMTSSEQEVQEHHYGDCCQYRGMGRTGSGMV
jgi:hypothetical protein